MYAKKNVKGLSLILSVALSASILFSGCGTKKADPVSASKDTSTQQVSAAETLPAKEELKPVTLKWYYESPRPKDADEVYAKANEILKKEINATVDFQPIDWGTFDQKVPLIISSGEEFDVLFSAPWTQGSKYVTNIAKGAVIPVDELLEKYAPLTKKMIPQNIWDGCKVKGKIYGIPNYQIMVNPGAVGINKAIADKYGFDPNTSGNTIFDLEPIFAKIHKGEPNVAPVPRVIYTMDNSADKVIELPVYEAPILGIRNDLKVFNVLDDPMWQEAYKKVREWYLKGYLPKDVATAKDTTYQDAVKAGKVASIYTVYKPGGASDLKNSYGTDFYLIKCEKEVLLSTNSITATMNCISKTSKNPERTMMLLEQLSQNKELYNTLVFGLEGKHYTKISDNRIEIAKDTGYSAYSWMMGNQFLAYLTPGQDDDVWQKTIDMNNSASKSPTCGFTFDAESVKTELGQVNAISSDFYRILASGLLDFDKFTSTYKDKYEKAGIEKIKVELQRQVDEWKANK